MTDITTNHQHVNLYLGDPVELFLDHYHYSSCYIDIEVKISKHLTL